jgi:hypothetical protein
MECVNRVRKTIKIMKKVDKGNLNYTPTYLTPSHDGCCNMRVLCVNKRRGGEREEENLILWLDLHLGQKEKLQKKFSHPCVVYLHFFCNPTHHETKSGIANRWENTNRKPHMDQSL